MIITQKKRQITAEEAMQLIGYHYFVNIGQHEEDFDLLIEQKLGKKSKFERDVDTLEQAIDLHSEILKQHCENAINRYKKYAESFKGKIFYFFYDIGLLNPTRKKQVKEYLNIVNNAKEILITGKTPEIKSISDQFKNEFSIPEHYPQVGQTFYVVGDDFNIHEYIVHDNYFYIEKTDPDVKEIYVESTCFKHDKTDVIKIHNHSILCFNETYYILNQDSKAFLRLSDAQEYAEKKLGDVIKQANNIIENNKTI